MDTNFNDYFHNWTTYFDAASKIEEAIERSDVVMFFKSGGDIFGTDEANRIAFADMKGDVKDGDIMFAAKNMKEGNVKVFDKRDLPTIKVIDKDEAIKELSEKKEDVENLPKG